MSQGSQRGEVSWVIVTWDPLPLWTDRLRNTAWLKTFPTHDNKTYLNAGGCACRFWCPLSIGLTSGGSSNTNYAPLPNNCANRIGTLSRVASATSPGSWQIRPPIPKSESTVQTQSTLASVALPQNVGKLQILMALCIVNEKLILRVRLNLTYRLTNTMWKLLWLKHFARMWYCTVKQLRT